MDLIWIEYEDVKWLHLFEQMPMDNILQLENLKGKWGPPGFSHKGCQEIYLQTYIQAI
jgi:hypothetical protein